MPVRGGEERGAARGAWFPAGARTCGCKLERAGPAGVRASGPGRGGRGREPVSPVCRGRFWLDQVRTVMVGSGSGRDRASWAVRGHVRPDRAEPVVK